MTTAAPELGRQIEDFKPADDIPTSLLESQQPKHSLIGVESDGYLHGTRHSLSEHTASAGTPVVVWEHGFGERAENGIGAQAHEGLVHYIPFADIVSIDHDGYGTIGEPIETGRGHGIMDMAERRPRLVARHAGQRPVIIGGTSEGTATHFHTLKNIFESRDPALTSLNIAGVVLFEPAIVPRDKIFRKMIVEFTPRTALDVLIQTIRTPKQHFLGQLRAMAEGASISRSEGLAMLRQGRDLATGTTLDDIESVLQGAYERNIPVEVVAGELDPIALPRMWQEYEADFPNLHTEVIRGRGHGLAVNGYKAGRKLAQRMWERDLLKLPDAA